MRIASQESHLHRSHNKITALETHLPKVRVMRGDKVVPDVPSHNDSTEGCSQAFNFPNLRSTKAGKQLGIKESKHDREETRHVSGTFVKLSRIRLCVGRA